MLRSCALVIPCLAVACGTARPAVTAAPPPQRDAAGDRDVRRLVLDLAQNEACKQLEGRWLGLPGQDGGDLRGADAGLASSWGRLQIRHCKSAVADGVLSLSFGGVGWTWVDRKDGAVGVRQYVYLSADIHMKSALDVGYDPRSKVASLWLTPVGTSAGGGPLEAHVNAFGTIDLVGDGILGQLEKAAAGVLGIDPKQKVAAEGARTFEATLRKGMTMTFDTTSHQVDLMLAPLPNGVVPRRPMPSLARPWLVNERQEVFPGGVQFSGPYDPAPAVELDAKWEGGSPASYGFVCATDATSAADALERGDKPALVLQSRGQFSSPAFSTVLVPPACPWVLVTSARGNEPARFALELTPADASAAVGAVHTSAATPSSATVWVTVLDFEFGGRRPDGKAWDFGGGAPDPKIWLRAASGTKLVVVPMMKDTLRASPMLRAPAAVEVSASSPLVVGATDVDAAFDDPMGEATVTLADVLAHREMDLELELGGLRSGTLHVRLEH